MSSYTPVFNSVFDGTMCGKWPTLPVWLTLLPLADRHGRIDMTLQAISARSGWPIDLLRQAIDELMQPDPDSRSSDHEGRRLIPLDNSRNWGWIVVNHAKYAEKARLRSKSQAEVESGKNAARLSERRPPMTAGDRRAPPVTTSSSASTTVTTATDTHTLPEARACVSHETRPDAIDRVMAKLRDVYPPGVYPERDWQTAEHYVSVRLETDATETELVAACAEFRLQQDALGRTGTQYVGSPAKHWASNKWRGPFPMPSPPKKPHQGPPDPRLVREQLAKLLPKFTGTDAELCREVTGATLTDVRMVREAAK